LKNNMASSEERIGLQYKAPYLVTGNEMMPYSGAYAVSRIANGLSENLRNVQKHRLLIQQEINDLLEKLMFSMEGRSVAANLTRTKKRL